MLHSAKNQVFTGSLQIYSLKMRHVNVILGSFPISQSFICHYHLCLNGTVHIIIGLHFLVLFLLSLGTLLSSLRFTDFSPEILLFFEMDHLLCQFHLCGSAYFFREGPSQHLISPQKDPCTPYCPLCRMKTVSLFKPKKTILLLFCFYLVLQQLS